MSGGGSALLSRWVYGPTGVELFRLRMKISPCLRGGRDQVLPSQGHHVVTARRAGSLAIERHAGYARQPLGGPAVYREPIDIVEIQPLARIYPQRGCPELS